MNQIQKKIFQSEIRWGAALHPSWNSVKWTLFSNNTAIRTLLTVALPRFCHRQHPMLPYWNELFRPPWTKKSENTENCNQAHITSWYSILDFDISYLGCWYSSSSRKRAKIPGNICFLQVKYLCKNICKFWTKSCKKKRTKCGMRNNPLHV